MPDEQVFPQVNFRVRVNIPVLDRVNEPEAAKPVLQRKIFNQIKTREPPDALFEKYLRQRVRAFVAVFDEIRLVIAFQPNTPAEHTPRPRVRSSPRRRGRGKDRPDRRVPASFRAPEGCRGCH